MTYSVLKVPLNPNQPTNQPVTRHNNSACYSEVAVWYTVLSSELSLYSCENEKKCAVLRQKC